MYATCRFLCLNIGLGRKDDHSLPQQTLVELFVSHLDSKESFFNEEGVFKELKDWKCITLNEEGNIIAIDWVSDFLDKFFGNHSVTRISRGGSIDFRWMPQTVCDLRIPMLSLKGSIDTSALPRGLRCLVIHKNAFEGSFVVKTLPQCLREVDVSHNNFSGELKIHLLPNLVKTVSIKQRLFGSS